LCEELEPPHSSSACSNSRSWWKISEICVSGVEPGLDLAEQKLERHSRSSLEIRKIGLR
jgi:hypothetical protein